MVLMFKCQTLISREFQLKATTLPSAVALAMVLPSVIAMVIAIAMTVTMAMNIDLPDDIAVVIFYPEPEK